MKLMPGDAMESERAGEGGTRRNPVAIAYTESQPAAENKPSKLVREPGSVKAAALSESGQAIEAIGGGETINRGRSVVSIAIVFEGALGLAGWALCAWQGVPLAPRLELSADVWLRSVVASAPMFLLLAYVTRSRWRPLVDLRNQVESIVGELFRGVSWLGLATVAIAAGAGEELLFRGALQPLAERWWGPSAGWIAVSVLFGVVHAASRTYFLFATAVGLYLGWLTSSFDDLVAPIVVHAAYDFAALAILQRATKGKEPSPEPSFPDLQS